MNNSVQQIPAGYKNTEIGFVPEEWLEKSFGDICRVNQGLQIPIEERKKTQVDGSKVYITIQYLNSLDLPEFISTYTPSVCCDESDILMTRTGNTGIVVHGVSGVFHNNFFKIRFDRKKINDLFLVYVLRSHRCQKSILEKAGTSTIPDLNHGDFYSIKLALPDYKEQTAIANALSDVDTLIQELEKLIAKKQAIKTATMQQLLTGRTRLPQFAHHPDGRKKGYKPSELGEIPEDWEGVDFSKIVWFQEGPGVRQFQFTSSGVKLLNGTNIENGSLLLEKTQRHISEKLAYGQYAHFMIDEGDILIACSGVTIDKFHEKVTVAKKLDLPLCLNTSTMRFKPLTDKVDINYIKNFLKSEFFKDQIGGKATGSAQLNFGPYHVNQVIIALPEKREQIEIALVLCSIDEEIYVIEQRLRKTRQIKQGMMQELLTGKTRLIKPAGAA